MGDEAISDELIELKKISKILALINAEKLESELSKYANTTERKKVWVSIDGKNMPNAIAQMAGLTIRATEVFLNHLKCAELIENPRGKPPKRLLNIVPPTWIELVKTETSKNEGS